MGVIVLQKTQSYALTIDGRTVAELNTTQARDLSAALTALLSQPSDVKTPAKARWVSA